VTELSDEIIMNRVKNGNLAELSVLFERYHVRLFNYMLKLTFDRTVGQDLTQNLFYRIIKYRHTFKDDHSFIAWVFQLARNVHIDYCRQHKKFTDKYTSVKEHDENIIAESGAFEEEEFELLDKALSLLSPEQREIIVLRRYQRLKYEEIAAIHNSSVSSVKVQVHRAIKQLRKIYFKLI
jgi:RNA polymerase sigma factor (sigma-70 family)